ncbi:MAG: hypothetical protein VYB30_00105 [Candidatus Thermoplasmatota archaeon]|nr:hypothetical protein [Candidatus Thermoplasmatota archaeon]
MVFGCPSCGWSGESPEETRSVEDTPVGYGGSGTGAAGGGGPDPGFVVMEKKRVTKIYCPECHKPLPKSQQPRVGLTQGESEQRLGRILLGLVIAGVLYAIIF